MVELRRALARHLCTKRWNLNLTVLQEIDAKKQIVYDHVLAPALKPLVNDVRDINIAVS